MKIEKKQKYNIGVFDKDKLSIAIFISTISLIAAILTGTNYYATTNIPESVDPTIKIEQETNEEIDPQEFEKGTHTIAIKINVSTDKIDQIPCYDGYKFTGICYDIKTKYALYTNDETVLCSPTGIDSNGNYVYTNFGIAKEKRQESDIYDIGKHTITVPINRPDDNNIQYEYHDSYEAIDMVAINNNYYHGGFIVYANTVPVKCQKDENGKSLDFGTPIETEKVKTLKQ